MDDGSLREAVESEATTQLDRFGSGKLLIALTGAELDLETVLAAAIARERATAESFEAWAADEPVEAAAETFTDLARLHRDRAGQISERLDDPSADGTAGPTVGRLEGIDGTVDRLGGAIGHGLLDERAQVQFVSFFVNEADADAADLFRSFREDATAAVDELVDLLDTIDASADDRERAREAAVAAIETAYDDYAESLAALGIDPKPVC